MWVNDLGYCTCLLQVVYKKSEGIREIDIIKKYANESADFCHSTHLQYG